MAVKKKDDKEENKQALPAEGVLSSFLKEKKEDHFNFEKSYDYRIPCSSLLLTSALSGGLGPGAHKFIGLAGGGKSSSAIDFLSHFLKTESPSGKPRRGIYIDAEGRLTKKIRDRSGINFVYDEKEWKDGTCFVFESNIYEAVFDLKRQMINVPDVEIFFITDSTDSLIKRDDAKKADTESITVGGGSLIFSVFLKRVGLAMQKKGFIDLYISQIRDQIKINPYEITVPKQGKSSGPRALEHQAGMVLEFLPRFGGDLIFKGAKKDKPIGHYCKVKILKTDNENYVEVRYPILYGQTDGKSVWTTSEIKDMLIAWGLVVQGGAWFSFVPNFLQELKDKFPAIDIPEKFQGGDSVQNFIEENEEISKYLFDKIVSIIQ